MPDASEKIGEFSPTPKSDWLAKVKKDLGSEPYESLRSRTPEGIVIEALYVAEDVPATHPVGVPGCPPFVRGAAPLGGWVLRQEYDDPRVEVCRDAITEDLGRGVEALWVHMGPREGCRVLTVGDLDELLGAVDLETTSVCLQAGADTLAVAAAFIALAVSREASLDKVCGGFGFDPLGTLARDGGLEGGLNARFAEVRDLSRWCVDNAPGIRTVCVDATGYHHAGASATQELAWSIASGVEYLRQLVEGGLSIDQAARQIMFRFASGGDFFGQIAKLRAARWLWTKVVTAAGGEPQSAAMEIHCRTAEFTKTKRDPWVNMIRATTECTAAVFGGAQSVATTPFDALNGPSDELARRVARNTQMVLRDESRLGEVADPAGGSWYIERFTDDLARSAWQAFQEIEAGGGFVAGLRTGKLSDSVDLIANSARRRVATRKISVVGVNEFPNLTEEPLEREAPNAKSLQKRVEQTLGALEPETYRDALLAIATTVRDAERAGGSLTDACVGAARAGADVYSIASIVRHGQPDFHVQPISMWRLSQSWESLRDRADRHARRRKNRTSALFVNLGEPNTYRARAAWTENLLAAAGIESVREGTWEDADASLGMICGSDEAYIDSLEPAVAALKSAGCPVVLVAGAPKEHEQAWRELGVSDFVYAGSDVLATMDQVFDALGVKR